jgi:carbamate kinase
MNVSRGDEPGTLKINGVCIVSLGGNALIRRGERGTIEEQFDHARSCMKQVSAMAEEGCHIVITHGNGPIVGNIVLRNEAAKNTVPPMPLYICDADSEGGIGYMLQQTIYNHLRSIQYAGEAVTVITQVVVDEHDEAFRNPSKPIGPFYSEAEAAKVTGEKGWKFVEDSGRGYRRVVPSPRPRKIIEAEVIRKLCQLGVIVIAAGGGGVPVVELRNGDLRGVDAVVDKDLSTSLLAREIGAEIFINLTQVDAVSLDYGKSYQRELREVCLADIKKYLAEGHFPQGSMGPKIEAAVEFLEAGGKEVIITSPERMGDALKGRAGTRIRV